MDTHGGIHMGILQNAGLHHHLGALHGLLGGLEHQLHQTLQLIFVGLQQLGGAQQVGGVAVVAAGVHTAVGGLVIYIGLLLHGQSVHVGTDQEAFASGLTHSGHNAAFAYALGLIAHLAELLLHIGCGLGQAQTQLGVAVEMLAVFHDFVLNAKGFLIQIHKNTPFYSYLFIAAEIAASNRFLPARNSCPSRCPPFR